MKRLLQACAVLGIAASQAAAIVPLNNVLNGLHASERAPRLDTASVAAAADDDKPRWEAHNLSVPVDHFHNDSRYAPHSDAHFPLRYWFDDTHYREGGPVIVLAAGETSGANRLPFLDHGIAAILARATNGLALVLEHRYYGASFPTPDLSLDNLRFLSTDQALADAAYFARNVRFPGRLRRRDLSAPRTAWVVYGGSYAGAFAAFARKLYPDVFWGAVSSSGVPAAIADYWEYLEAARRFAPGDCAPVTQRLTRVVDAALSGGRGAQLKGAFGLGALPDADFGNTVARGILALQSTNWDPDEDAYDFGHYCGAVTSTALLYRSTAHLRPAVEEFVARGGYAARSGELVPQMLNYIGYVRSFVQRDMRSGVCRGLGVRECYSRGDEMDRVDLEAGWLRSWSYQVCTQWGYFITGSGVPADQLPLISRAVDLEYASAHCWRVFNITAPPDVDAINRLGGFALSYPRLAFVDGAQDPWRAAGAHRIGLGERESTTDEPFVLVDYGVHHWDENGPANATAGPAGFPPAHILDVQRQEVEFVKAWMDEFHERKRAGMGEDFPGEL